MNSAPMNKKKSSEKIVDTNFLLSGFTLIELLIVVAIMTSVFFVGLVSYQKYQKQKVLEDVAMKVMGHVRLAQQLSMSGTKPDECIDNDYSLVSIEFVVVNERNYDIRARCQKNVSSYVVPTINTYSFPPDYPSEVVFDGPPFPIIVFYPMGKGVESDVSVTLKHPEISDPKTINVSTGGKIYLD